MFTLPLTLMLAIGAVYNVFSQSLSGDPLSPVAPSKFVSTVNVGVGMAGGYGLTGGGTLTTTSTGIGELGWAKTRFPKPSMSMGLSNPIFLFATGFKGYAAMDFRKYFRETRNDRLFFRTGAGYVNHTIFSSTNEETGVVTAGSQLHGGGFYGGFGINRNVSQNASAEFAFDVFGDVLFGGGAVNLGFSPVIRIGVLF